MKHNQILNYKIISEIGKGGMATVYKAKHLRLETNVAIKVLDPVLATNENIRHRFMQEAKILAKLNHNGITKIIDFDESENKLAIVMEFLEGQTLNDYIHQNGALSSAKAKEIFFKILKTFDYAHNKGIVHRDIKPSNIFLTQDGDVKVMDFGIAKIKEEGALLLTQTGTQMGTPVYMSPEQVNDSKHIDHLSDIYSLGVCLWMMLTGKPPYDAKTDSMFSIYKKIDSEPLTDLQDEKLNVIVKKATSKNKDNRFENCETFINALKNEINEETIIKNITKPNSENEKKIVETQKKIVDNTVEKSKLKTILPKESIKEKLKNPTNKNVHKKTSWLSYYLKAFSNYAVFKGRASRTEFWSFYLFDNLFSSLFLLLGYLASMEFNNEVFFLIPIVIYFLITFLPSISIKVRRFHDFGFSGWLTLLILILQITLPFIVLIFIIDSQKGENKYGLNPKQ